MADVAPCRSAELADRLNAWIEERRAGRSLLVNARGRRFLRTTISEMFTRIGHRARIGRIVSRTHQFRHVLNGIARRHPGLDVQQRAALLNDVNTATLHQSTTRPSTKRARRETPTWAAVLQLTGGEVADSPPSDV